MVKRTTKLYKLSERFGKNKAVKAGVLADSTYPDGKSVAQVAFWNEFGTNKFPPRPFMRNAINENKDKWVETLLRLLKSGLSTEKALGNLGEQMVNDIRQSIISGEFEPNSEVTLLLKSRFPKDPEEITFSDVLDAIYDVEEGITAKGGKNKPLQWTGDLLRSIKYEVDDES